MPRLLWQCEWKKSKNLFPQKTWFCLTAVGPLVTIIVVYLSSNHFLYIAVFFSALFSWNVSCIHRKHLGPTFHRHKMITKPQYNEHEQLFMNTNEHTDIYSLTFSSIKFAKLSKNGSGQNFINFHSAEWQ